MPITLLERYHQEQVALAVYTRSQDGARAVAAEIAALIRSRQAEKRPVVLMMGAHAIKVGLNPVFVDAMRAGLLHAVAFPHS